MRNTIATLGKISWDRRLMHATVFGLLIVFAFAQPALGQVVNGLTPSKSYFVTGDYVVGGWDLTAGTISIPDNVQAKATGVPSPRVPVGADILAAFLYWETVESTAQLPPHPGQKGFFNGFAITGTILGNPNAPSSWSSGGCAGSNGGVKTIVAYRADVRPFLPVDPATGRIQANGSFPVNLTGAGSNQTPFTLGASLVIIYRVQASPLFPLNAIVLYDGAAAPSNQTSSGVAEMIQDIQGFYQPDAIHKAKITHIVGDGQPNKGESVKLNGALLPNLYPTISTTAWFPGVYNGSWDNPTWDVTGLVKGGPSGYDTSATTSVVPAPSSGGCVDWGAIIFSTTVQASDGDGLLDVWKANPGYTDVLTGQAVALPGAKKGQKDIFVQIDYLSNLDGLVPSYPRHSHLPKQLALDMVGDTFALQGIHIHFDVGPNYAGNCSTTAPFACPDPYIVQAGTGGNKISESSVVCTDSTLLCQFPGQAAVGWKEGFLFLRNQPLNYPDELSCETQTLANGLPGPPCIRRFQPGGKDSRHYVLFGHSLGAPRSFWNTFANAVANTAFAKLISIVNSGTTATVTIKTPQGLLKPGDCPNSGCDANSNRVTVTGAIGQVALNGTYLFSNLNNSLPDANKVVTTTFNIATTRTTATCTVAPCVADGTYNLSNQPQLAVAYGGPGSSSGHSDLGGGDSIVTFGLWPSDDVSGCQVDPSLPLAAGQTYCSNQVGTITAEAGTLLHELGHTFFLTHGGTFFPNGQDNQGQKTNDPPNMPSYGLNCSPSFLSTMNYLHQIRGFPDGGIGYSGQTMQDLSEIALDEGLGIGADRFTRNPADHFTRWYAPPSALDIQLGRFATRHCDGTPILDGARMTRVTGTTYSSPIDWNNDGNTAGTGLKQDVNFNNDFFNTPAGSNVDAPFAGYNDWLNLDLRQTSARANTFGFSGGNAFDTVGGNAFDTIGGNAFDTVGGNAFDTIGGNALDTVGGNSLDTVGGNALDTIGGNEQDAETACSTADPPTGLTGSQPPKTHNVVLNWTPPGVCQVSRKAGYTIWRAVGSFSTITPANRTQFVIVGTVNAPSTMFTDNTVKNNTTYTYFVTDTNTQGATSGASNLAPVVVSF